ncbi:preprotein translocase subunit YajC [Roseospira goensis]|uniref:Sec translocon accessory complex subunit YajC n=1 Tax=Roseospira goensis TaxID=391922 RepID=A0A7W6S295_9PROT|nr:preprotein translocase subunit YajC [Roseospira goensis]MBB4286854.1 preprotein translocase subunit YajC [Roseospira goensis]
MLISPAYAQAAGGGGAMESLGAFLPLILIFVIFYFLLIRPQQKRMKEHKAMLEAVRRGDRVVTNGGIVGTVVKVVNETELSVEIAEGVRVRVMREMIANVLSKTEPVSGGADKTKGGKPRKDAANEGRDDDGDAGDDADDGPDSATSGSGTGDAGQSGKLKSLLSGKKS